MLKVVVKETFKIGLKESWKWSFKGHWTSKCKWTFKIEFIRKVNGLLKDTWQYDLKGSVKGEFENMVLKESSKSNLKGNLKIDL